MIVAFCPRDNPRPVSPFARGEVLGMARAPVELVRKRAPGGEAERERAYIEPVPCRLREVPVRDADAAGLMDAAVVLRVMQAHRDR